MAREGKARRAASSKKMGYVNRPGRFAALIFGFRQEPDQSVSTNFWIVTMINNMKYFCPRPHLLFTVRRGGKGKEKGDGELKKP
jgi:hypothetical protein